MNDGSCLPSQMTGSSALYRSRWRQFASDVAAAEDVIAAAEGGVAFAFVDGALVKALREGSWLLLDEINLAPPEARRHLLCRPCFLTEVLLAHKGSR